MIDPGNDEGRPAGGGPCVEMTISDPPIVAPPTDELAAARSRRAALRSYEHLRAAGLDSELVRRTLRISA